MSPELDRHCRTLGVTPPVSAAQVRQAYRDLVQVWHPDRFAHDPRLQKRAEARMREINAAFAALKNGAVPPAPPFPAPGPTRRPAPRRPPLAFRLPRPRWTLSPHIHAPLGVVAVTAVFIIVAGLLLESLSPIDPPFGAPPLRPSPRAAISRFVGDLMRSLTPSRELPAQPRADEPASPKPQPDRPPRVAALRRSRPAPEAAIEVDNGTELIAPSGRTGAGVIVVHNTTSLDSAVMLALESPGPPVRMVFVRAAQQATLSGIAPGNYTIRAELGSGWRRHARTFAEKLASIGPLGPFSFTQITSERGVESNRYDVILKVK